MKLKALQSAVALLLLAGPVSATQPTSPERGGAFVREALPQDHLDQDRNDRLASDPVASEAAEEISAALEAKIRAIIAYMREDAHNASDSTKVLRSRIRVRCSVRQIIAKPKASLTAAPAVLSEQAASATLEACTIKLLQLRSSGPPGPAKREYSVELPAPAQTAP
jgi:hypothetical protein